MNGDILLYSSSTTSESRIYKATDGENFVQKLVISGEDNFTGAAFSGTSWVVSGVGGVYRSSDFGETWALVHSVSDCVYVTYGSGAYVVGTLSSYIYFSIDDGVTWSTVSLASTGITAARNVCYTGTAFLVTGAPVTACARSLTGAGGTWSGTTLVGTASAGQLVGIASGGGTILVCGNSFSPNTLYLSKSADDGVTWTDPGTSGLPSDTDISGGVVYGEGVFVCSGRKGLTTSAQVYVAYSSDNGATWTQPSVPAATSQSTAVAYSYIAQDFKLIASLVGSAGARGILANSPTGVTWGAWGGPTAPTGAWYLYSPQSTSPFWTNLRRCVEI